LIKVPILQQNETHIKKLLNTDEWSAMTVQILVAGLKKIIIMTTIKLRRKLPTYQVQEFFVVRFRRWSPPPVQPPGVRRLNTSMRVFRCVDRQQVFGVKFILAFAHYVRYHSWLHIHFVNSFGRAKRGVRSLKNRSNLERTWRVCRISAFHAAVQQVAWAHIVQRRALLAVREGAPGHVGRWGQNRNAAVKAVAIELRSFGQDKFASGAFDFETRVIDANFQFRGVRLEVVKHWLLWRPFAVNVESRFRKIDEPCLKIQISEIAGSKKVVNVVTMAGESSGKGFLRQKRGNQQRNEDRSARHR
jgi:hypothetical protein